MSIWPIKTTPNNDIHSFQNMNSYLAEKRHHTNLFKLRFSEVLRHMWYKNLQVKVEYMSLKAGFRAQAATCV